MTKTMIGLLSVAVTVASMSVAHADAKNYPGSMCVETSGTGKQMWFSSIRNNSTTSTLHVDCPVVKDNVYGSGTIKSAWMKVMDQHPTESVSCTLYSVYGNSSGNVSYWYNSVPKTSGGNSQTWQTMNFGTRGANTISHYFFGCSIPRRSTSGTGWSYILSYQVDES